MHVMPYHFLFFGEQFFRFDMWKEDQKISNHFDNFNNLMINIYNLSIYKWYDCIFFSNVNSSMSNLCSYNFF